MSDTSRGQNGKSLATSNNPKIRTTLEPESRKSGESRSRGRRDMTMMRTHRGGSLVVIQSWMNWRPLAALWIQEEDKLGTSCGENMGSIREHWLVQHSFKTVGRRNRMLKKPMERIGRMVLTSLTDRIYICNKIKLNYACKKGQEWSNNSSVRVSGQERHENELRGWL